MTRILVAYDASADADRAVELILAMQWPADTRIRVVTSVDLTMTYAGPPLAPGTLVAAPEIDEQLVAYHRERLEAAVERLRATGRSVEAVVLRGRPATMLLDDAAAYGADLVVVGSRGHGAIASLVLGSVSAEVVDHARCPVLVARRPSLTRVVLAADGSAPAAAAESLVARWPIFAGTPIRVVSVADVPRPWTTGIAPTLYAEVAAIHDADVATSRAEHERIAAEAADRLRTAGRQADVDVRTGPAAAEIIEAARAWDADLVVVGSRGRAGLTRMILGSVARNVLHGGEASVLVVHPPAAPGDGARATPAPA